jgi:2-phosphosulfolactate phosphatase
VRVDVVLTADEVVPGALAGATVLVVDVLRASTTIIAALAAGCAGITPVADPVEARRRAGAHGVLLAGERRGEPIPGFDLGNSPLEFTRERVGGRTVVLTTSNGTRALLAAREAHTIGIAAFVNLTAATEWVVAEARDLIVICAGERGRRSLEDHVCAGLLVEGVRARAADASMSPAALEALAAARRYGREVARLAADSPWARKLAASGRGRDVTACLALDTTPFVPRYLPSVDKVVSGRG